MIKQSIFVLIYLTLLINTNLIAQNQDSSNFCSVEKLKEDFRLLRHNMETIQTGLYTYTNKTKMDRAFDSLEMTIKQPLSSVEFYRKVILLNQFIKNGHTSIKPSVTYEKQRNELFTLFPFEVYLDNDILYVLKNNSSNDDIQDGSIIKSINGEDAVTLYKEFRAKLPRDGFNTTFPDKVLSSSFNDIYANLRGDYEIYNIELISLKGETLNIEVNGLTKQNIKKNKWNKYQDDSKWWGETQEPVLNLRTDDNVAIMEIKVFSIYYAKRVKQNFKDFFNESFSQLIKEDIEHLVIDLRNNGGGDEKPTLELLSHLNETPFVFYEDMYVKTNKTPNPKFYNQSGFSINFLYPLFKLKKKGEVYGIKGIPGLKEFKPAKSVFKGDVYVLTNGFSFSATGEIASHIKNINKALFVGEEVGGNTNQHVSGTSRLLTLPNSKIRVRIPIELFKLNVKSENTGHGVIPDYYVRPTITDKLLDKDPEMEFVFKLIEDK
ncbi:S41 family peptidase [uncultured Algibacter sp.]|uniref:S41 family peptidase n=1 Tax=uncultured Algibacter sp. TaxID=298659 RepID=UPI0026157CC8|nr:S41 family peptidase [uncultured Algibacter sp.]